MSNYVDTLITMLRDEPEKWCPLASRNMSRSGSGSKLNDGVAYGMGQIRIDMSLGVAMNGVEIPTTIWDMWRLRWAVRRWYKTVDIKNFETTFQPQ